MAPALARGEFELRMPALMVAAAWSDVSDGECGDGWFSLAVIVSSGVRRRVGDGGSELRSSAIVSLYYYRSAFLIVW